MLQHRFAALTTAHVAYACRRAPALTADGARVRVDGTTGEVRALSP
jgi:hypothetical protein